MLENNKAIAIQNHLSFTSAKMLESRQINGVIAKVDGRDATLTGSVADADVAGYVEKLIAMTPGIRRVTNNLIIEVQAPDQPSLSIAEPQSSIEITKLEQRLTSLDLAGIQFLFGNDVITEEGATILDEAIHIFKEYPEFDVAIEGHTDNVERMR